MWPLFLWRQFKCLHNLPLISSCSRDVSDGSRLCLASIFRCVLKPRVCIELCSAVRKACWKRLLVAIAELIACARFWASANSVEAVDASPAVAELVLLAIDARLLTFRVRCSLSNCVIARLVSSNFERIAKSRLPMADADSSSIVSLGDARKLCSVSARLLWHNAS